MEKSNIAKRFYFLKHLCDAHRIELTYEDPEDEDGFREAASDLEAVLQKRGIIRVYRDTGRIRVLVRKGGTDGNNRNPVRRTGGTHKKILPLHGPVYAARPVWGAQEPLAGLKH